MNFISVHTTLPDEKSSQQIAKLLLNENLIACVNYFPVKSFYRWKGDLKRDDEFFLIMKTREELYSKLESRLKELHPYDVPEIIKFRIENGLKAYLSWVEKETENIGGLR